MKTRLLLLFIILNLSPSLAGNLEKKGYIHISHSRNIPGQLTHVDASGITVQNSKINRADWSHSLFHGAHFQNAVFKDVDFSGSRFDSCKILWSRFINCKLPKDAFKDCFVYQVEILNE